MISKNSKLVDLDSLALYKRLSDKQYATKEELGSITGRIDEIDETFGAAVSAIGDEVTLLADNQGRVLEAADKIDHVDNVVSKATEDISKTASDFHDMTLRDLSVYADGLAAVNERMNAWENNMASNVDVSDTNS